MIKMFFTLMLMLVSMFTITSCDSNNGKMFIVEDKPVDIDYMGPSRFDTLFVHEQIQPDKSIKYTFELRRSWHDIYTVEDCTTVYDKNGKEVDFNRYDANGYPSAVSIELVTMYVDDIIGRIMEDDNVSEDDKAYVKAAYRQIFNHKWPTDWSTY